ncbi:molybdenum cofactor guanylyltransferase [Wohlfahrtiimonas chitiniclastica]|uniref:molybdenum cofactor guanylyltransferase n=1 Tax=Wohlfahrtiimonas chitiniclastica TaxID=400946 RepID=UPI0007B41E86|nr:molybdenum cofactor guanylyltransferase [Wohlfahrtiimonas chitiniclastica]KZS23528.1 molybdenum cofactor guanylyltransferase [Wohlfahrtiimonas chitiniclastica]MDC7252006.1 molybdenum cofactor guanylyltransferase [Wohlfahrtiimonas chitiniclastica]WHR55929.1 molybdenum cofactor guanylyltransferase [Wohlfahrtiimonas chitiniclastica]
MSRIIGLILSGGAGSRLGGVNKGLVDIAGKPLAVHVYDRLAPQVDAVYLSANHDQAAYRNICANIIEDQPEFYRDGPLAGLHSLIPYVAADDLIQVVTCDAPLLPRDLVAVQQDYLRAHQLDAVWPSDGERDHYGVLMVKGRCLPELTQLLKDQKRRIRDFLTQMNSGAVPFADPTAFINGNDSAALERIATILKDKTC